MFGEGFDLPELKIAALHDRHRSLSVTIQFTGRFTRQKDMIGNATIVVNQADQAVDDALRKLDAEDSDWNKILRKLSEGATQRYTETQQFLEEFPTDVSIPTQNVTPKMSTVVYRTTTVKWHPQRLSDVIPEEMLLSAPAINTVQNVAYFVTREVGEVEGGTVREFENISYDLYVLF